MRFTRLYISYCAFNYLLLIGVLLSQRVSSTREKGSDHDVNCTSERQLGIYESRASDRECRRLKLIDWEEELRTCCEQSTSQEPVSDDRKVCGSRYNGTYGTFYYNECALIYDRYQHPEECIVQRWGDFRDCERCGINQTQPPPCVPRCAQASHIDDTEQANLGMIGVLLSQRVPSTRDKDSDYHINCTSEQQLGKFYNLIASDRECRRLTLIDWEEELRTCCEQSTSQEPVSDVCGSRYNGTYGTFYYNECALIYDRYQHPEECIIRRWGDFSDCERRGIVQEEPPTCPFDDVKLDYNCDVKLDFNYDVRIIDHVDGCTSSCTQNSSVKFFCGDFVPRPPTFPLRCWPFREQ